MAGIAVSSNFEQEPEGFLNRSFESRFLSSHRRGLSVSSKMRDVSVVARGFGGQDEGPQLPQKSRLRADVSVDAVRACIFGIYHVSISK